MQKLRCIPYCAGAAVGRNIAFDWQLECLGLQNLLGMTVTPLHNDRQSRPTGWIRPGCKMDEKVP